MASQNDPRKARPKNIALWSLTGLLALFFVFSGTGKLLDGATWIANFEAWGLPGFFAYVIGASEVAAGALLLWPRSTSYAAATLAAIMAGAAVTHLANAEYAVTAVPVLLAALSGLLAWARRPHWFDRRVRGVPA